ncbi:PDR/VanB family oxidoreductase [Massilia sp. MS-15]|uniref:PDR/VanB family oxidoreductase n=1 Tax=Massilia sp. MS-15 TaxID=2878200 RepID=UPI001CD6483B|nr:PDR/VanB family oxidoreductase [Massilia sp. MS-15]MCA1246143.1 PDR/VanB family oxidoreductase [Massilia sp. MS-15]
MNAPFPMPAAATPAAAQDRLRVRLQSVRYVTRDIQLFEFVDPAGAPLPATTPGAHVDVHLANGITRSYSLIEADPAPGRYLVGVKRDPNSRGGSRYMHETLRVGAELTLSQPRNLFPLKEDAPHSVLFAGGIGITPILCMAGRLAALGAPFTLWYASRTRADLAFLPELARFGERVHLHVDEEAQSVLDMGAIVAAAPASTHFYCCGPAPMLAAYEAAAAGRAPETVHLERFGASAPVATGGDGFVVQLARSGVELRVPSGATILQVLNENGIAVDSSCEAGICGCCEVAVLEGEVEHRDEVLTAAQRASNKSMMVCCSRARCERLVLDL